MKGKVAQLLDTTEHIVVLGDFNCEITEPIHHYLKSMAFFNVMETVGGGIELTMDTKGIEPHSIDHIYVSSSLKPHLTKAHVVRDEGFRHDGPQREGLWVHSDHLPVVVELAFP